MHHAWLFILLKVGGKEFTHRFHRQPTSTSIIVKLVFAYFPDTEVVGLGMADHKSAYTGVRFHGSTLREADTYLVHPTKQTVDDEVEADVGQ
jgi:hypothetical protein